MAPRSDPRIDEAVAIWFRDDMPNRKAWELAGKPGDEKSIQNIRKCMRMASARADAEAEAIAASPAAVAPPPTNVTTTAIVRSRRSSEDAQHSFHRCVPLCTISRCSIHVRSIVSL